MTEVQGGHQQAVRSVLCGAGAVHRQGKNRRFRLRAGLIGLLPATGVRRNTAISAPVPGRWPLPLAAPGRWPR